MDFSNIKLTAERIMERPEWEGEAIHWTLDLNGEKVKYSEGLGHFIEHSFDRPTYEERCAKGLLLGNLPDNRIIDNPQGIRKLLTKRVKPFSNIIHKRSRLKVAPPDIKDVLYSLTMDASGADESFSDWCDNIGCDDDSIKAKKVYDACQENAKILRRLGLNLDELQEFFQDY